MTVSVFDSKLLLVYACVFAAVLGAVLGSFLNCAAWRIAHGESFLRGRSHCPACGHVLGAAELVPVFSWLFLRGKCRWCGEKVSVRYPLTELLFALLTVLCLLRFDLSLLCLRNLVFLSCLFCLSLVDLESRIIPDGALLTAAAAWLLTAPFVLVSWQDALWHAAAGLVFAGGFLLVSLAMDRILGRESLGGGDVKLFAVVGLYLGLLPTLFTVILACVLGLLLALFLRKGEDGQIPFGPAIAAAAAVMLLYGEGPVRWYMGLMGF